MTASIDISEDGPGGAVVELRDGGGISSVALFIDDVSIYMSLEQLERLRDLINEWWVGNGKDEQ